MSIEIKRSVKPVEYNDAIRLLEKRLEKIINNQGKELIWFLEHKLIYTAGTSFNKSEVLDKSIKVIKTNRGGKITCHAPGQLVCYLVIDLNKRNKDIRIPVTGIATKRQVRNEIRPAILLSIMNASGTIPPPRPE